MSTQFTVINDYDVVVAPDKDAFLDRLRDELEIEMDIVGEDRIQNLDAHSGKWLRDIVNLYARDIASH